MSTSFGYFAISLNAKFAFSDVRLNMFFIGLVELPSYILAILASQYLGRRSTIVATLITSAVLITAVPHIPQSSGAALQAVRTVVALAGKLLNCISFSVTIQYTTELYPTTTRYSGFFLCNAFARMGSALAPHVAMSPALSPEAGSAIIGGVSLLAGLLILMLPETRGATLPQTIEDAKKMQRCRTKSPDKDVAAEAVAATAADSAAATTTPMESC